MRRYTEAEARALLPEVIPVLERLRDAVVALRALRAIVAADARGVSADGHSIADPWGEGDNRLEALGHTFEAESARLEEWGIEVKDPDRGLIDFYSDRHGELVYLCFMLGEPDLAHWHTLTAGFAGRQPL